VTAFLLFLLALDAAAMRESLYIPDPLPPLEAETHGTMGAIERVSFRTQAGMRLPALLYLPKTDSPVPAVIVTGAGLAAADKVVLAYPSSAGATVPAAVAPRLEGLAVTELMQAVSYLASRPEVDPKRIAAMIPAAVARAGCAIETRLASCSTAAAGASFPATGWTGLADRFSLSRWTAEARAAAEIERRARELAAATPAVARGTWGFRAVRLDTGDVIARVNSRSFFVPASNTKLFSTALALTHLGPEHRFVTRVLADSAPDDAGVLRGGLRLTGSGDPTLSARAIPYRKGPQTGDSMTAIEDLADQLVRRGLRRVDGAIVGDDSVYVWDPYPPGWAQDDALYEYGAPVSALVFNDNSQAVALRPGDNEGDRATVRLSPPLDYFAIDNRVATIDANGARVRFDRPAGSRQLLFWGTIHRRSAGFSQIVAVDDPARWAAFALREALLRRGVTLAGEITAHHRWPHEVADLRRADQPWQAAGELLAYRVSPPLAETLKIINKVSQNLHAEIVLRETGRARRNIGSREAGLEEMKAFLASIGVAEGEVRLEDGSGLSRLNLVSPWAVTRLLDHMHRSPHAALWTELLPIGNEDGTLANRFRDQPRAQFVQAKTGSLSGVNALSGYAMASSGRRVAFSILVNNTLAEAAEVRRFIDRIGLLLVE
jgi:D-alanyl-D-alanine carboxypeptidase/D-alanyl-D-alanine-endopeptidase (penicillin-binding protein 4)